VLIGSPLEPALVERIAAVAPGRIRVVFEPDLLPTPRYVADHKGIRRDLTPEQEQRWRDHHWVPMVAAAHSLRRHLSLLPAP
jgi:hypothetical protein